MYKEMLPERWWDKSVLFLISNLLLCKSETKTLEILTLANVLFFCPFNLFCQHLFHGKKYINDIYTFFQ